MGHVIEHAASGRAKCRGCGEAIARGELRFGERQPNAFGDGEMTLWFHLRCAAFKRPEPFLEALNDPGTACRDIDGADTLEIAAEFGIAHRRVPRINGADRAPTGRARCRSCREPIAKDSWRIGLMFFEEYRFQPSGFIHAGCAREYFGTVDVLERAEHFGGRLNTAERRAFRKALKAAPDRG